MDAGIVELITSAKSKSAKTTAFGKVTATSPFTVQFNGTAATNAVTGVMKNTSYTPTIGDLVFMVREGASWIAICAFA